jgi:hypothetical protein
MVTILKAHKSQSHGQEGFAWLDIFWVGSMAGNLAGRVAGKPERTLGTVEESTHVTRELNQKEFVLVEMIVRWQTATGRSDLRPKGDFSSSLRTGKMDDNFFAKRMQRRGEKHEFSLFGTKRRFLAGCPGA